MSPGINESVAIIEYPQGWTFATPPTSFPLDMIQQYWTAAEVMTGKG